MKAIVIDDEPLALEVIKMHCSKVSGLELIGAFLSSVEGVDYLNNNDVDIAFVDINMPEINGLSVRGLIPSNVQIVFVTAYEEHALKSYDLNVTDYVLKPLSFERFYRAVQKCKANNRSAPNVAPELIKVVTEKRSIVVKEDKKVNQILVDDILFVEGFGDYVKIHLANQKKEVIRESLKKIDEHLQQDGFIRVHRSFIVPLKKISAVVGNTIQIERHEIPLGKGKRDLILMYLGEQGILGDRSKT